MSQHQVASSLHAGGYLKKADFTYTADSRPKTMDNDADHVFDRNFTHDFAGRSVSSYFGTYHPEEGDDLNPHIQTITYDAFSNVTSRETEQWGTVAAFARTYIGSTGRMDTGSGETLTYDASGNVTYSGITANTYQSTVYDAAGRRTEHTQRFVTGQTPIVRQKVAGQEFDGDGDLAISSTRDDQITSPAATGTPSYIYYVNSSVLDKTISEIGYVSGSESTRTTRVFAGGAIIAEMRTITGYSEKMAYFHADPVTGSKATVWQSGAKSTMLRDREEFEPLGQFVRHIAPPANENPPPNPAPVFNDAKFPEWQCKVAAATGKKNGELPTHCGSWEKSVWDRYPLSQKDEGNASKVSPPPPAPPDSGISKALATTAKPVRDGDDCKLGDKCVTLDTCKLGTPGCIDIREDGKGGLRAGFVLDSVDVPNDDPLDVIDVSRALDGGTIQLRPIESAPSTIERRSNLCDYLPDNLNNPATMMGASLMMLRGIERLLGQDFLADSMKIEASFMGGSVALQNARDGDVLLNVGGGLDPKGMFFDIPNSVAKGTKIMPSVSFTGQKILAWGNLDREARLGVFENWSGTAAGGYKLYGGVDVSNDRTVTINAGTGTGINVAGLSWAKRLFRGCLRW